MTTRRTSTLAGLPAVSFAAFLVFWFHLGGGAGCDTGEQPQIASPSDRDYTAPPWINASGVIWTPPYHVEDPGVDLHGGESYLYAGGVDGPLPLNAVYECSSTGCAAGTSHHCPGGSSTTCGTCPVPCYEYHNNEAFEHQTVATTGRFSYRDTCGRDYGDGISAARDDTAIPGEIEVLRSYFTNVHDDGVEHDWCKSMMVKDSLFDRVFMGFAMKPRTQDPATCTSSRIQVEKTLVYLHHFANAFEQKPGHGGVFKLEDGNLPWFIMKDSVFFIGPVVGDEQHILPPPSRIAQPGDCVGNVLLFSGDATQRAAWLADSDGADALTNQQKLNALSYCYQFIYTQPSQTFSDFFYAEWLPRWNAWINSHQAFSGC